MFVETFSGDFDPSRIVVFLRGEVDLHHVTAIRIHLEEIRMVQTVWTECRRVIQVREYNLLSVRRESRGVGLNDEARHSRVVGDLAKVASIRVNCVKLLWILVIHPQVRRRNTMRSPSGDQLGKPAKLFPAGVI